MSYVEYALWKEHRYLAGKGDVEAMKAGNLRCMNTKQVQFDSQNH